VQVICGGRAWELGAELGEGGFGKVFEARASDGREGAAKLVPKAPGSDRELLFVDLGDARNIVPIIDQGETDQAYVLIMPKAERSLKDEIAAQGPLAPSAALPILTDVAEALASLDGRVVHRDLKPGNILLLDGHWCLADFGISRYAEASTAPDTQKYAMSFPYAAPERWRFEHATNAADVYALGVVAYQLLTGSLPFPGPTQEDFRHQHLHENPPRLTAAGSRLRALVDECLYKAPQSRPTPANVLARLQRAGEDATGAGASALASVHQGEVARLAEDNRAASVARSDEERRAELRQTAARSFEHISESLLDVIRENAPTASVLPGRGGTGWTVQLRNARLTLWSLEASRSWNTNGRKPAFEVVSSSAVSIDFPPLRSGYAGRSHSLYYCDAKEAGSYGWYETAFMPGGFAPSSRNQAPWALHPGEEAARALAAGIDVVQCAWPFTKLDDDSMSEFVDRWIVWFATAANGQLQHPSQMPERDPNGRYRTT
jgi:serine/threonine-protein kinase